MRKLTKLSKQLSGLEYLIENHIVIGSNPIFDNYKYSMPTILQLITKSRKQKLKKNKLKLNQNPQKKAVCLKILTMSPKKPK